MSRVLSALLVAAGLLLPSVAVAQEFETTGARALGMGGAFVAVADDVTAAWWNPAGLATGPFFSLALEHHRFESERETGFGQAGPAERHAFALGMGSLPLALSYHRTSSAWAALGPADAPIVQGLATRQFGATVVQSLSDTLVVAATLKYVRGEAVTGAGEPGESPLDVAADLDGDVGQAFDVDLGLMFTAGRLKAGLTVRNALSPEFDTAGGGTAELPWRARAGLSYLVATSLLVAVDADLRAVETAVEEQRRLAVGAEWRPAGAARLALRAGTRIETVGDARPLGTVGASYAVRNGMWVDVWAAGGDHTAERGWGLAGRILF